MEDLMQTYGPPILFTIIWMIAIKVCEIIKTIKEDKKNVEENKQLDIWEHF